MGGKNFTLNPQVFDGSYLGWAFGLVLQTDDVGAIAGQQPIAAKLFVAHVDEIDFRAVGADAAAEGQGCGRGFGQITGHEINLISPGLEIAAIAGNIKNAVI